LLDALLAQVQRIVVAPRWEYPDAPGSAHVPDLASQLTPEDFVALRATTAGSFILDLLESFEVALNDDWLPFELAGLPLPLAREFLRQLGAYIREHHQLVPLEQARTMHRALVEQVA